MVAFYDAGEVEAALTYERLVPALQAAFAAAQVESPVRGVHHVGNEETPGRLLTMPAWRPGQVFGVKLVNVFPTNGARGLGAVHGVYALFDGSTGIPTAIIEADALTNRRTAATSALASTFLSRMDSETLTLVGTGNLAFQLAQGHCAVRPIRRVLVWGRSSERAAAMAANLAALGLPAEPVSDLSAAVAAADIVTSATTSNDPLVLGQDVRPGTHVDLVGAFTPTMRESDDALIRASDVYVDTYAGALGEAGDLLLPVAAGVWSTDQVKADLYELCGGTKEGRTDPKAITLFKSVGASIEDLVAAELVAGR
ncbi:ornithine cyclodeaminase [Xanthobacter flavus]|uniref:Ornithine cyclodeaminase n=1 Tax=Xanthobacter flavus TaxID=281 RepID=A0A9W6CMZ1_XANFL|nr:ornithine cyclodeaminase family protein [Xanthobacter flavus]MDR6334614.1 ornithine cyclodeaminase [Xanthobacter flavus]GLI23365.1 ornithine cyclodeaminase [Xanthobacter flavus]